MSYNGVRRSFIRFKNQFIKPKINFITDAYIKLVTTGNPLCDLFQLNFDQSDNCIPLNTNKWVWQHILILKCYDIVLCIHTFLMIYNITHMHFQQFFIENLAFVIMFDVSNANRDKYHKCEGISLKNLYLKFKC